MNIYQVFNVNNALISTHDSAADALKQALIYQHATGKPAHVEQVPDAAYQAADEAALVLLNCVDGFAGVVMPLRDSLGSTGALFPAQLTSELTATHENNAALAA